MFRSISSSPVSKTMQSIALKARGVSSDGLRLRHVSLIQSLESMRFLFDHVKTLSLNISLPNKSVVTLEGLGGFMQIGAIWPESSLNVVIVNAKKNLSLKYYLKEAKICDQYGHNISFQDWLNKIKLRNDDVGHILHLNFLKGPSLQNFLKEVKIPIKDVQHIPFRDWLKEPKFQEGLKQSKLSYADNHMIMTIITIIEKALLKHMEDCKILADKRQYIPIQDWLKKPMLLLKQGYDHAASTSIVEKSLLTIAQSFKVLVDKGNKVGHYILLQDWLKKPMLLLKQGYDHAASTSIVTKPLLTIEQSLKILVDKFNKAGEPILKIDLGLGDGTLCFKGSSPFMKIELDESSLPILVEKSALNVVFYNGNGGSICLQYCPTDKICNWDGQDIPENSSNDHDITIEFPMVEVAVSGDVILR